MRPSGGALIDVRTPTSGGFSNVVRQVARKRTRQDDAGLIREVLGRQPGAWHLRPYILFFCFAPAISLFLASVFGLPAAVPTIIGQIFLAVATFVSLRLLSDR